MVARTAQLSTTPRRATSRQAVLSTLRAAYPAGLDTMTMIGLHGPSAQARVGELVEEGWLVDTDRSGPVAVYRLASLTRGTPDPMTWGLRATMRPSSGLVVSECSTGKVKLPPESWARLKARLEAVVREELAAAGIEVPGGVKDLHPGPEPDFLTVLAAYHHDEEG